MARRGPGKVWRGAVRLCTARFSSARPGQAWRGLAELGGAWQGRAQKGTVLFGRRVVMARPRKWFATRDYNTAYRFACMRRARLWKYTRGTRDGKESGYFVGDKLPMRLNGAEIEEKMVRTSD